MKKKRRIQWYDRVPKNSTNAGERLFGNSRINHGIKRNYNSIVAVGQKPSLQKAKEITISTPSITKSYERASSAKKVTKTPSTPQK